MYIGDAGTSFGPSLGAACEQRHRECRCSWGPRVNNGLANAVVHGGRGIGLLGGSGEEDRVWGEEAKS
jgi:hypothetical protein